jgi:hypothetical protein
VAHREHGGYRGRPCLSNLVRVGMAGSPVGRKARRGVPLETIGALLGHKDPKMTKRYAHLSPASLKAAVTTLQDLRQGTKREHTTETKEAEG